MIIVPNYSRVYKIVIDIIQRYQLKSIPIDLYSIIAQTSNLKLCSYSQFSKNKCSIQETIDFFGSELGAYARSRDGSKCVIYYNDTKHNIGLDRFTIAHELGHHFLGHSKYMLDGNILLRGLSNPNYAAIEKEANCFARNLLSPIYIVRSLKIIFDDIEKIKDIFCVTKAAAKTRVKSYNFDLKVMTKKNQTIFDSQFKESLCRIRELAKCNTCGYYFSKFNATYCPICGNNDAQNIFTKYGGISPMIYDGLETENGKVKECPVCKNEQLDLGNYCPICGTHIVNICTNLECEQIQEGNARYCAHCGYQTTFFRDKLLKAWNAKQETNLPLNAGFPDFIEEAEDEFPF